MHAVYEKTECQRETSQSVMDAKKPSSAGATPRFVAGLAAGERSGSDEGTEGGEATDAWVTVG
jgi:hypothetical protein